MRFVMETEVEEVVEGDVGEGEGAGGVGMTMIVEVVAVGTVAGEGEMVYALRLLILGILQLSMIL